MSLDIGIGVPGLEWYEGVVEGVGMAEEEEDEDEGG